jgi:hypothetical protein
MNRLPPLPFDFSVRDAFGEREIPVDLEKPTSFIIALFATIKEIFPERKQILEKYEDEKITKLFDEYQTKLDFLLDRRREIQHQLIEYKAQEQDREARFKIFASQLITGGFTLVAFIITIYYVSPDFITSSMLKSIIGGAGVLLTMTIALVLWYRTRMLAENAKRNLEESMSQLQFQNEMSEIESEINQYKNLIATRSRELLIDTDRVLRRQ